MLLAAHFKHTCMHALLSHSLPSQTYTNKTYPYTLTVFNTQECMHVCTHTYSACVHTCAYVHTCMCVCACVCTHVCIKHNLQNSLDQAWNWCHDNSVIISPTQTHSLTLPTKQMHPLLFFPLIFFTTHYRTLPLELPWTTNLLAHTLTVHQKKFHSLYASYLFAIIFTGISQVSLFILLTYWCHSIFLVISNLLLSKGHLLTRQVWMNLNYHP